MAGHEDQRQRLAPAERIYRLNHEKTLRGFVLLCFPRLPGLLCFQLLLLRMKLGRCYSPGGNKYSYRISRRFTGLANAWLCAGGHLGLLFLEGVIRLTLFSSPSKRESFRLKNW